MISLEGVEAVAWETTRQDFDGNEKYFFSKVHGLWTGIETYCGLFVDEREMKFNGQDCDNPITDVRVFSYTIDCVTCKNCLRCM